MRIDEHQQTLAEKLIRDGLAEAIMPPTPLATERRFDRIEAKLDQVLNLLKRSE